MTDPITEDAERELRALYERATPGEWERIDWGDYGAIAAYAGEHGQQLIVSLHDSATCEDDENAAAIVALHNALPSLLAALDEARARADRAEAALEIVAPLFHKLDKDKRNAPGHSHQIAGVWDDDLSNGERRGKPCHWCADWARARVAIAAGQHRERGE